MIIDVHMHIGDILSAGGGALSRATGVRYPRLGLLTLDDMLLYRQNALTAFIGKRCAARVTLEERRRNAAATLENAVKMLDATAGRHNAPDGGVCAYIQPIAPHVTFDDALYACARDARLHAFGSPDFTLDGAAFEDDLKRQAAAGAAGLKIHPILQRVPLDGARVLGALDIWRAAAPGRPVLLHTGQSTYYPPALRHMERPEYSDPAAAGLLIGTYRDVPFILGHAGLFEWRAWAELARFDNVYADGSFHSPASWRALYAIYGGSRLLYASDWPYGNARTALKSVLAAFSGATLERVLRQNAQALLK